MKETFEHKSTDIRVCFENLKILKEICALCSSKGFRFQVMKHKIYLYCTIFTGSIGDILFKFPLILVWNESYRLCLNPFNVNHFLKSRDYITGRLFFID